MENNHNPTLWQHAMSAGFIFEMNNTKELVYVIAENRYAVCCLEKFSAPSAIGSKVCKLVSVLMSTESVSFVYPNARKVPYVEFILHYIERSILLSDIVVFNCFVSSLSEMEMAHVKDIARQEKEKSQKMDNFAILTRSIPSSNNNITQPLQITQKTRPSDTVLKALQGLGFSKPQVESWAKEINAEGMSNGELVKAGCRMISKKAS